MKFLFIILFHNARSNFLLKFLFFVLLCFTMHVAIRIEAFAYCFVMFHNACHKNSY